MDQRLRIDTSSLTPTLFLSGQWGQAQGIPDTLSLVNSLAAGCQVLAVDGSGIAHWDTTLAAFLKSLEKGLQEKGIKLVADPLPKGVQRLMSLVRNAKPTTTIPKLKPNVAERVGAWGYHVFERVVAWNLHPEMLPKLEAATKHALEQGIAYCLRDMKLIP